MPSTSAKFAVTPAKPASDKQIAFIRTLAPERDYLSLTTYQRAALEAVYTGGEPLTSYHASKLIDALLHTVRADSASMRPGWLPAAQPAPVLEPGFYLSPAGAVVRVQHNKAKTSVYGKVLDSVTGRFAYVAGATRDLVPDARLTLAQAAELGQHFGRCVCCGAELTDPDSVAAGIGPVCAAKYF
jgi:hypothetical protein